MIGAVTVKPVKLPTLVIAGCADAVTVAALPVTLPLIGVVTVKPVKLPNEVISGCDAPVTFVAFVIVPENEPASIVPLTLKLVN